jgi:hypothetical protein
MRTVLFLIAVTLLMVWPVRAEFGFDEKYERDYNIFNPINQLRPDNPLNPINSVNPRNPFNPINEVNPNNPLNPINQYNPNTPFRPLNTFPDRQR